MNDIHSMGLCKKIFSARLNNEISHLVTDWIADGYLEHVSLIGTRSHTSLEALDTRNGNGKLSPWSSVCGPIRACE
jgi:hypothetical protein